MTLILGGKMTTTDRWHRDMLLRFAAVGVTVLALAWFAAGQDLPVMGDISALQGKTKVYIQNATSDERKLILRVFKNEAKKVPFVVVGDPDEAEIFMNFGELTRMTDNTAFNRKYQERDELEVYYYDERKRRVIVFTDTETLDASNGLTLSYPNSYNLTRNFFKAYRKSLTTKP